MHPRSVEDPNQLPASARRIGQRAQKIEQGSNPDLTPRPNRVPGGAVVCRRKHESDAHCVNGFGNLLWRKRDIDAGRFQHIGTAGLSGRGAVAVFGHNGPGGTSSRRNVIAVVQPHRYSRVRDLFDEFCTCFNDADTVIVTDIYPAGETPLKGINKAALIDGLRGRGHRHVLALKAPEVLPILISEIAKADDFVVCLGAGNITAWANELPENLAEIWSGADRKTAKSGGDV